MNIINIFTTTIRGFFETVESRRENSFIFKCFKIYWSGRFRRTKEESWCHCSFCQIIPPFDPGGSPYFLRRCIPRGLFHLKWTSRHCRNKRRSLACSYQHGLFEEVVFLWGLGTPNRSSAFCVESRAVDAFYAFPIRVQLNWTSEGCTSWIRNKSVSLRLAVTNLGASVYSCLFLI